MSSTKLTGPACPHSVKSVSTTYSIVLLRTAVAYVSSIAKSKYFSIKKQLQN